MPVLECTANQPLTTNMDQSPRKVALVTASSAGLGAATARAFASNGFNVIVNYLASADRANELVEDILKAIAASEQTNGDAGHSLGPRCTAIKADMSRREDVYRLVDESVRTMGRLDVVVSNQGWTRMRDFNDLDDNVDETDWDGCFNMNVKSHLWLFHAAKPYLLETSGAFVGVASLAGVVPSGSSIVSIINIALFLPH
jgi:NAD(P)-dependent dehydrogenase (short-subunit alcohol dehydrogenase family)